MLLHIIVLGYRILDVFFFYICNNDQELKKGRRLLKGEEDLHVGSGARVVVLAGGTYNLTLPSGILLELDKCYFVYA